MKMIDALVKQHDCIVEATFRAGLQLRKLKCAVSVCGTQILQRYYMLCNISGETYH